jgi:maleylpyruvate isomerase
MRTREVWVHAVDLDNGATFADIPEPVLARLLQDITGAWKAPGTDKGLVVKASDRGLTFGDPTPDSPTVVSGLLAAVVEWATGRGTARLTATPDSASLADVPAAPKWI